MADEEKKPYTVMQEGRDGAPIEIEGSFYKKNDTVLLTDAEAKYRVGVSVEPAFPQPASTPVGEHREKGIDVDEDTRPMQDVKAKEEDTRSEKRGRSATATRD